MRASNRETKPLFFLENSLISASSAAVIFSLIRVFLPTLDRALVENQQQQSGEGRLRKKAEQSPLLRGRIAPRGAARAQVPRSAARRVPVSGCAACSRQPLEAARVESEGPFSPISRREPVCVSWVVGFLPTFPPCAVPRHCSLLAGRTQASEPPYCGHPSLMIIVLPLASPPSVLVLAKNSTDPTRALLG